MERLETLNEAHAAGWNSLLASLRSLSGETAADAAACLGNAQQQPRLQQQAQQQQMQQACVVQESTQRRVRQIDTTATRFHADYSETEIQSLRHIAGYEPDHL